uniref:Hypoxia up-regulated protein 1 n=1 Tax=Caenorhabditis tropicalis TaxID=1561998 RepID=A0A1I7US88_9PELO
MGTKKNEGEENDVVITVPIFLNQAERRAIATAAEIAGLNLLQVRNHPLKHFQFLFQLLNDGSAAALNYGVFRRKEITEKPMHMLIYDMGAVKTTATIVQYVLESTRKDGKDKQPTLRTVGVGYDKTLGGLEITNRLRDHLEKVFRDTVSTSKDISTNGRAIGKLHKEAERVKQVLSANKDTYAQVESLFEEQNFRAKVTRDELEKMIEDLEPRIAAPILDAIGMSGLKVDDLDLIVLMGAGTRVPKVKDILKSILKDKEISNFLNTDEAIAMGAVYQAAHLSKSFKVLPFNIHEKILYPVFVNFLTKTEEGVMKPIRKSLFGENYPVPNRVMHFSSYSDDFKIEVQDADKNPLSSVEITGVKDAIEKEVTDDNSILKGVKTTFSIDLSGIVSVEKASVVVEKVPTTEEKEQYEVEKKEYDEWEKEQEELKKKEKAEKKEKEEKKKAEGAKAEDEKKEEEEAKPEEVEKPVKVKKTKPVEPKAKKINVALTVKETKTDNIDLNEEQVTTAKKILGDFEQQEKEKHDREEAMNGLEGLLYDLAVRLEDGEEYAEYVTDEEKKAILEEVAILKLWFEDDVSIDTKKEEFDERRKKLDELTVKPNLRKQERLDVPKVAEVLEDHFNRSMTFHAMALNLTQFEEGNKTFTDTELDVLTKLIEKITEWWNEKKELFEKQAKNEDPVVKASEVAEKARDLEREVRYLVNKLKIASSKKSKESEKKKAKKEKKTTEEAGETPETTTEEQPEDPQTENETTKDESATEQPKKEAEHDASEL